MHLLKIEIDLKILSRCNAWAFVLVILLSGSNIIMVLTRELRASPTSTLKYPLASCGHGYAIQP